MPAIARIYSREVESGVATYEYAAPDEPEISRRWRTLAAQGYPFLVAESGARVAGYAYASAYRAREGYRWTVEDTVYVDAVFRGQRVGCRLLQALIDACTGHGFRHMVAVIGDRSNAASIALHRRHGFEISGVFPGLGYKHGRWLENVQMLRSLGPGAQQPPD